MNGAKDLLDSERGVFCILLVLACSAFVVLGKMSVDAWVTYTQWIAVTLVASKTMTGVAEMLTSPKPAPLPTAVVNKDK